MKHLLRNAWPLVFLQSLFVMLLLASGCQTGSSAKPSAKIDPADLPNRLRPEDLVSVDFSGVTNPPERFNGRIKEDGTISLPFIGQVVAAGKTTGELEKEIHDLYVPKLFVRLTVNVNSENRFYTVYGEVRNPSRQVYSGEMGILKAIASAGGFTDFARKTSVKLIRANGQVITVNCKRAVERPELDLPVYPGDQVFVPRRYI